jgi:Homing endonuclease associated repeat
MTKEEIVTLVRECTAGLGHAPTMAEFQEMKNVTRRQVEKIFGTHKRMLAESGVEREGPAYPISMHSLFLDWARITRSLGKVPRTVDYERLSRYSTRPLNVRFGSWRDVPTGLLQWARQQGLEDEWKDVLEIIFRHQQRAARSSRTSRVSFATIRKPALNSCPPAGQPAYGRPLPHAPLSYAPTNEAGVVLLFGSVARELGFVILRTQAGFPDCEALRELEPNRWQKVRIEFEYESYNFFEHMHPAQDCDLIVCWNHNWPDCPVEVLELQSVAEKQPLALSS